MDVSAVGAATRFAEMANLFSFELPLSAFQDKHPESPVAEPRPYIDETDRGLIRRIIHDAGETLNAIPQDYPSQKDEAAFPFLGQLLPFADRYFPGQVSF